MTKEICYWAVGDGDSAFMLQTLVDSYRNVGMQDDFHVFSQLQIKGAETHLIGALNTRGFLFKIAFLQTHLKQLGYRYYVYLDADTVFVRKPRPLVELMHQSPIHFFLENPLNGNKKWWNCTGKQLITLMRDCGVTSKTIYTLNSGCFILRGDAIDTACGLAMDFWEYALGKGYQFPDEPAWAYAMHMLCDDPEKHLLRNNWDIWCSDWEGVFAGRLPDGKEWTFRDYMTGEAHHVNPAIIHALRSKDVLINLGKSVFN
jgi:hypothetical protein